MRLRATSLSSRQKPLFTYRRMEQNMLAAVRAAGGSVWYVSDDFLVLGPNVIENGDFSQGSAGWNPVASTFSVSNGEATVTATSTTSPQIYRSFPAVAGKSYLLSFEAKNISGSDVRLYSGGILSLSSSAQWTPMSGVINASSATPNLVCLMTASAVGQQGAFRNIKVQEVLSAKDFQDSAGTLPIYLGGTVGLGLDATAVVGQNLVTNMGFDADANWFKSAGWAISGGVATATSAAIGSVVSQNIALTPGKSYVVSFDVLSISGGQVQPRFQGGVEVLGTGRSAIGTYTEIMTAVSGNTTLALRAGGSTTTATIDNISVKEISGNHVTQATAGNRPTITRIPRKLGPELVSNGEFNSSVTWSDASTAPATAAISGGVATLIGDGTNRARLRQLIPLTAGKNYAVTTKLFTPSSAEVMIGTSTGGSQHMFAVPSAGGISQSTFMAVGDAGYLQVTRLVAGTAQVDSISVSEVLEWGYALTFDGANDSLAAPASVIGATLTQPYTMLAWGKVGALGAARRLIGDSARSLGVATTGRPYASNHGVVNANAVTTMVAGQSVILESTWDGATLAVHVNGTKEGEIASAAPTTPAGLTFVGQRGGGIEYWNAEIGGAVVCPGVMTDAQRLAVRKFAAAQMGLIL